MIYNEETYCIIYHRTLRELGAIPTLLLNTIAGIIHNSDACISNAALSQLLGISEKYIRNNINLLITLGYIEKHTGNGRGKKTVYVLTEKGEQNAPLYGLKRGNKTTEKGGTKRPLNNKDNNKDFKSAPASARAEKKNKKIMEDKLFIKFWELFIVPAQNIQEKERCFGEWNAMDQEKKDAIIQELEKGHKSVPTQSPYVYLYNFKAPLPFYRQGNAAFGRWYNENIENGIKMSLMRFDGSLAYCLASDKPKMMDAGAEFLRDIN